MLDQICRSAFVVGADVLVLCCSLWRQQSLGLCGTSSATGGAMMSLMTECHCSDIFIVLILGVVE